MDHFIKMLISKYSLLFMCLLLVGPVSYAQISLIPNDASEKALFEQFSIQNSCNFNLDAGNDTSICAPGGSIQLQGNVDDPNVDITWSPASLLDDPNILDPIATVSQTTEFVLEATGKGPNLILNWNFDLGNVGFSSDYVYSPTDLVPEGTYAVIDDPSSAHNGFQACSDHTPGPGGNMMVVNGSSSANENVWCQTINNITPNRTYEFSSWVTSVNPASPAELQFSINGVLLGSTFNVSGNTCMWQNFFETWDSGTSTSATICIVNQNTAPGGNDFAIDDIAFNELCVEKDTVVVELLEPIEEMIDTAICNGESIEFAGETLDQAGPYEFNLTTSEGCDSILYVNLDVLSPNAFIAEPEPLDCNSSSIFLDASGSSGNGTLIYEWNTNNGQFVDIPSGPFVEVNRAGTYSLIIWEEDHGIICASDPYEVEVELDTVTPNIYIDPPPLLSCPPDTVILSAQLSPANGNYEYSWSSITGNIIDGENSLVATVDQTGVYIFRVTNLDNGCFRESSVTVERDANASDAMIKLIDTLDCRTDTIQLSAEGSQPMDGQFQWKTKEGNIITRTDSSLIQINREGKYTLILTGNNNCVDSASVYVNRDTLSPQFSLSPNDSLNCSKGTDTIWIRGYDSLPPYTVQWRSEPDSINILQLTDSFIIIDQPGQYIAEIQYNSNACVSTDTVTIVQNTQVPEFSFLDPDTLRCASDSSLIIANLNDPTLPFNWTNSKGRIIQTDTHQIEVGQPGWYFLQISDPSNQCTFSDSVFVPFQQITYIDRFYADNLILNCYSEKVILHFEINGNDQSVVYSLIGPADTIEISSTDSIFSVQDPGMYVFHARDTVTGCSQRDSLEIMQDFTLPIADAGKDDSLNCMSSSLVLNGGNSVGDSLSYNWFSLTDTSTLLSSNAQYTATYAGQFILKVQDRSNGCIAYDTVRVFENVNAPEIRIDSFQSLSCINTSIILDASRSDDQSGLTPQWTLIGNTLTSDSTNYMLEIDQAGTYVFQLTDTITACMARDTVEVEIDTLKPAGQIIPSDNLNCKNDTVEMTVITDDGNDHSYSWTSDPSGNIIEGNNSQSILLNKPGMYSLLLTNMDNGCSTTLTKVLEKYTMPPVAHAGNDQFLPCQPKIVALNGTRSSKGDSIIYQWRHQQGHSLIDNDSIIAQTTISGYHILQVTNTNNGCWDTDTVYIRESSPYPIDFTVEDPTCLSDGIFILHASQYNDTAQAMIDGFGRIYKGEQWTGLPAGQFRLQMQNELGCLSDTVFEIRPVKDLFIELPEEIELQWGDTYQIHPTINFSDSLIQSILWEPSDNLDCANCLMPYFTGTENTQLLLKIIDVNGCEIRASINITIDEDFDIYVPNAFTPNRDGINDIFTIYGSNYIQNISSFEIYDRWGELILDRRDVLPGTDEASWDGKFQGELLPAGVYVYKIEIVLVNGRRVTLGGDVGIIQ